MNLWNKWFAPLGTDSVVALSQARVRYKYVIIRRFKDSISSGRCRENNFNKTYLLDFQVLYELKIAY